MLFVGWALPTINLGNRLVMKKLRILHLVYDHPDNPWCGGGGAGRTWAINKILAEKHDITVYCGAFPNAEIRNAPFKVRYLGNAKNYVESRLKFIQKVRTLNVAPYDLIVEEFSYYAPILSNFSGRPLVSILQGHHGLKALKYRGIYGVVSLISEYILLPTRRAVILVSEHLRPAVHPSAQTAVIGQGVDLPQNLPSPSQNYVLFLGRLDIWHKGLDILVKAWSRLPTEVRALPLHIVGGGDINKLGALINSVGAKNIKLVGRLDHDAAIAAINRAIFLCMPSRMEGSPLVLYEAFALGKPVIGSSIPPIKALISDGVAGLLFPPQNIEALAEKIKILTTDLKLRSFLSLGAKEIGKTFNWQTVAEKQEKFYFKTIMNTTARQKK